MFCRAALVFRELKAFVESTRITASVSAAVNSWRIAFTAASQPNGCAQHLHGEGKGRSGDHHLGHLHSLFQ